jgi:tetratricopeptide (TPR) repeat protein
MGGVRNGKSAGTPEPAAAREDALRAGAPDVGLLREGSAARAFGALARASRTEPMTPRLAAALVRFALLAGTEAAAITLLDATSVSTAADRLAVRRQLARVLRRVGQLPRAIASLEALLAERPQDRRARRGLQELQSRLEGAESQPASGARGVLSKRPTRKAGVQGPAIWDEDAGYREPTQVESSSGTPAEPSPEPSHVEPRTKTELELPAVTEASNPPPAEARPAAVEPPVADTAASPLPPARHSAPSVPWPEEEAPAEVAVVPPVVRDARVRPPREGAWAADEDTGEVTSEALPFLPGDAPPETPSRSRVEEPSPARAERTKTPVAAQAATGPVKDPPAPAAASPSDTQEVSLADLEAALGSARASGATPPSVEPPRPGESPGARTPPSAPPARVESTDASGAGQGRVSGSPPEAGAASKAEDAEELARSQKLEAQLIARQAWRELAQLYLKRADRAKDVSVRAEALTRLAEVMETELQDPAGAARMYREIVDLTGDRTALREQMRLLSTRGDASLVRRALDEAIHRARSDRARAGALLTRGERWLHMGEPGKARADFEAAEALAPGLLPVLAGLLRCVTDAERPAIAERLRVALAAAPRRAAERLEGLRLLAQAAETSLGDPRMAQWAWTEVLAESPESEQARGQLVALARRLGDLKALGHLLRAQLAREPRGPSARQARLELVSTLDALGDADAALHELRQAVRFEPGHKEAWLLLVDRLTTHGSMGEAAWALEHAATATEDELERERTWERLARLWRDVLRNPERAQVFARRAEGLRQAREEREAPPPPEPPRGATPREPGAPQSPLVPAPATLSLTPSGIAALANEVTSTTAPGAPPTAVGAPPVSSNEGAGTRAREAEAPSVGAPAARAERAPGSGGPGAPAAAPPPSQKAAAATSEPAPKSSARRGKRAPEHAGANAPPAVASPGAVSPGADRAPASAGTSAPPASAGTGAVASPRTERGPAASPPASAPAASSARAEPRIAASAGAAPASGAASAPAGRAEQRPTASPGAGAEQRPTAPAGAAVASAPPAAPPARASAAPAAKPPAPPRGAPPRMERPPASPRPPPVLSEVDPSVPVPRPPASGPRASESPPRGSKAMDLMGGEDLDLGSAPVPETRVISWEAPPGRMDPVRRIVRPRAEGTAAVPAAPAAPAVPGRPPAAKPPARVGPGAAETRESPVASEPSPDTEPNAFRHIRERPLDAKPYRELAEYFDSRGDTARASLMREIADALDGRESPAPRVQRPSLTTEERAGLRHPGLRTPSGELLACAGIALCRLFPAQGRAAGTAEPLRASAGPGAPAVLDALHTAARVLDVNLPELVLAEDDGPPFTAVHAGQPRLLVGRLSIRQPLPAAELRFHAGRALLSLSPDLLALRALKGGQLLRALALLTTILKDPRASGPEARVVRESLSPRALERAVALLEPGTRDFDASALADAARDSANRAGLVACGSVGPALAVLRARRNQDSELVELLRFAASERYLELRAQR